MPPSANEIETEKPPEYTPIKILLKQVYAAHTAKVKELESEVQSLKQELDAAKRETGEDGKTVCMKCREMQLAYDACKEEYKNAVLEQTRKLKELELKFLSIEKSNCRSPNASSRKTSATKEKLEPHVTSGTTACETPGESLALLDWDESTLKISVDSHAVQNCPSADPSEERSASGHMMPPPVSAPAAKTALNRRKIFGHEISLSEPNRTLDSLSLINSDVVLVPDSLETSRLSSPVSENLKRAGKEKTVDFSPENKENDATRTGSNEPSQKIRKCSLSKKRALSDVTFSDSHNKRFSAGKSAEIPPHTEISTATVTDHNEPHADRIQSKKPEVATKNESSKMSETSKRKVPLKKAEEVLKVTESWAANFEDFDLESSNMQQSFSIITGIRNPKPDVVITDEDCHMPVSKVDESGSWKMSLKKNVPKKPAPVKSNKSVSRFKMTLEAPDPNVKKPSYKQMKLTSSVFQSKNASKDNGISIDGCRSNDPKPSACGQASATSQVGLSELASLAGHEQTCVSNDSRPTIPHAGSDASANPQLPGDVETFCVIDAITVSKDSCDADEKLNLDDDDELKIIEMKTSDHAEKMSEEEEEEKKVPNKNICDSFDRLPVPQEPNYKYKDETVRNKSKRKQLTGFNCKDCEKYYTELGLNEEERKERMQQCSRHRAKYVPPPTPDHFWELDFPSTEECRARGYVAATQNIQLKSRRRRPLADEQFI